MDTRVLAAAARCVGFEVAPGSHLSTRKKPEERSKQEKRVRCVVLAHAEAAQDRRRHTSVATGTEVPTFGRGFQYRDLLHKRRKTCPPVVVRPQCLTDIGGWRLSHGAPQRPVRLRAKVAGSKLCRFRRSRCNLLKHCIPTSPTQRCRPPISSSSSLLSSSTSPTRASAAPEHCRGRPEE